MPIAPFLAPERDEAFRIGRAKRSGTTHYCIPGLQVNGQTTFSLTSGTDQYFPWRNETPIVIDQLACEVTAAAGTNFRIGFYVADADWQPIRGPLADSGNLSSASTGVKTYTPATPIYVPRGRYLSIINADAGPTFRAWRGGLTAIYSSLGANGTVIDMEVTRAYAAFPTPGTAWTIENIGAGGFTHPIVYRVLAP